jgi:hypothetical protein
MMNPAKILAAIAAAVNRKKEGGEFLHNNVVLSKGAGQHSVG